MGNSKLTEMIMMTLANVYSEMQSLKDFIIEDFASRNNLNEEQTKAIIDSYNKSRQEYQIMIIAQLRAKYDPNLGSVDDLLNNL